MLSKEQELYALEPRAIVCLYELDLNPIGIDRIIRFVDSTLGDRVIFRGDSYTPWPMKLSKIQVNTEGPLPEPTIELANYEQVISEMLDLYDPAGAIFRRRRIYVQNLDNGTDPDPSQEFEPDEYKLDSYIKQSGVCGLRLISAMADLNLDWPPTRVAELRDSD